jgi:hypothetical protein
LAEREKSLRTAEKIKIDLADSNKKMEDELASVGSAIAKERQLASKMVIAGNLIQLTAEPSVERNYAALGGSARQIQGRKARITCMCG